MNGTDAIGKKLNGRFKSCVGDAVWLSFDNIASHLQVYIAPFRCVLAVQHMPKIVDDIASEWIQEPCSSIDQCQKNPNVYPSDLKL